MVASIHEFSGICMQKVGDIVLSKDPEGMPYIAVPIKFGGLIRCTPAEQLNEGFYIPFWATKYIDNPIAKYTPELFEKLNMKCWGMVLHTDYHHELQMFNTDNGDNLPQGLYLYNPMFEEEVRKLDHADFLQLGNPTVDKDGNTPLILACYNKDEKKAMEILDSGRGFPDYVNSGGITALSWASVNLPIVAMRLVKSGKSNPGQISKECQTALIFACACGYGDLAHELLNTGESRPEVINLAHCSAMIFSFMSGLTSMTDRLLKMGHAHPDVVTFLGHTPLIYACKGGLEDIAIKLIDTGKSRPFYINREGQSALSLAYKKGLTKVIQKFEDM